MSLIWNDKNTTLCSKGRYFHEGMEIPSGILTKERIEEFLRTGLVIDSKKSAVKAEVKTVKTDDEKPSVKSDKKSDKKSFFKKEDDNIDSKDENVESGSDLQ